MTNPRVESPSLNDDDLTYDEVQRIKYETWSTPSLHSFRLADQRLRIVAEGDSWFDYMPGIDVLDHLKRTFAYEIYKVADAGDTLENMVYGTEVTKNFSRKPPPIEVTLDAIRRYQPPVFIFSGGGNDIAGPELESLLNHRDSGLPSLRNDYIEYIYSTVARNAYEQLIRRATDAKPDIQVIFHGYGRPIPDGRAVTLLGFRFAGPWLRPALARKNYVDQTAAREIMTRLANRFNQMLGEIATDHENVHYLDLRDDIRDEDWVNELHLKNSAFGKVAKRFHEQIQAVVQPVVAK